MTTIRVSEHDPELFESVRDPAAAAAASLAETEWLEIGPWHPEKRGFKPVAHYGLLVLEGVLIRSVALGVRDGLELLGPGDVVRPWVDFGTDSSIQVHARCRCTSACGSPISTSASRRGWPTFRRSARRSWTARCAAS